MVIVAIGGPMAAFVGLRKAKIAAGQEDELRQLVRRYEHLAETVLDAQQRVAADMADVRSRTASVEQIEVGRMSGTDAAVIEAVALLNLYVSLARPTKAQPSPRWAMGRGKR